MFFEPEFKVRRADQAKTQKVATVEILELAVVGSIHGRDDPTEAQAGPMVAGEHANLKPVGDELDPVGRHLPLGEGLGAVQPRPDRIDWAFDFKGAFEDMALKPLGVVDRGKRLERCVVVFHGDTLCMVESGCKHDLSSAAICQIIFLSAFAPSGSWAHRCTLIH